MQTNVGDLICTLAESGERVETPPSQTRAMVCTFKPNGAGPEESYSGEIQKLGSQTALNGKRVLLWVVMGPADRKLKPALLEQTFVGDLGSSADSGAQPPSMLVGESDGAYALRPMTENGTETAPGNLTVIVLKVKSIPA
jgi:hypothetical protein